MFNFFCNKRRRHNCYQMRNLVYGVLRYNDLRSIIENTNENILIDVRSKKEYEQMHIVNAVNIPVDEIMNGLNEFKDKKKIIVYCSTGERAKKAIRILNNIGYNNVYIWMYASIANFPFEDMIKK